jgi:hypothetical protein
MVWIGKRCISYDEWLAVSEIERYIEEAKEVLMAKPCRLDLNINCVANGECPYFQYGDPALVRQGNPKWCPFGRYGMLQSKAEAD